jgi:small redox-active disulfide protein 2
MIIIRFSFAHSDKISIMMSKEIKVFGVGSSLDKDLLKTIQMAIQELGITIQINEFNDIQSFLKYKISAIPAMMVDNEIVVHGRVPSVSEIKKFLTLGFNESNENSISH